MSEEFDSPMKLWYPVDALERVVGSDLVASEGRAFPFDLEYNSFL